MGRPQSTTLDHVSLGQLYVFFHRAVPRVACSLVALSYRNNQWEVLVGIKFLSVNSQFSLDRIIPMESRCFEITAHRRRNRKRAGHTMTTKPINAPTTRTNTD